MESPPSWEKGQERWVQQVDEGQDGRGQGGRNRLLPVPIEQLFSVDFKDPCVITTAITLGYQTNLPADTGFGKKKTLIKLSDETASVIVGRNGRTKQKIAAVSGARLTLNDDLLLDITGTHSERDRAEFYMKMILRQRQGGCLFVDFDETCRPDLSVMDLKPSWITGCGLALKQLEDQTNTLLFFARRYQGKSRTKEVVPINQVKDEDLAYDCPSVSSSDRSRGGRGGDDCCSRDGGRDGFNRRGRRSPTREGREKTAEGMVKQEEAREASFSRRQDSHSSGDGTTLSGERLGASNSSTDRTSSDHNPKGGQRESIKEDYQNNETVRRKTDDDKTVPWEEEQRRRRSTTPPSGKRRRRLSSADEDMEMLLIFGDMRSRRWVQLQVMAAIELRYRGMFSQKYFQHYTSKNKVFGTDRLVVDRADLKYANGKDGGTRRKISRAANCLMEFVGNVAFIAGTAAEVSRGRDYLAWLIKQRRGGVHVDIRGRTDVITVSVPADILKNALSARPQGLRNIEADTSTYCLIDAERTRDGRDQVLVFGHSAEVREKARELLYDFLDRHGSYQNPSHYNYQPPSHYGDEKAGRYVQEKGHLAKNGRPTRNSDRY